MIEATLVANVSTSCMSGCKILDAFKIGGFKQPHRLCQGFQAYVKLLHSNCDRRQHTARHCLDEVAAAHARLWSVSAHAVFQHEIVCKCQIEGIL